jgi:hypothetical protein
MKTSPWHLENYTQLLLQLFSGGNISLQNAMLLRLTKVLLGIITLVAKLM